MNIPYTLGQKVSFITNSGDAVDGKLIRIIEEPAFNRAQLWIKRQNKPTYIATLLYANHHQIEIA